jgi:hypothetical protein
LSVFFLSFCFYISILNSVIISDIFLINTTFQVTSIFKIFTPYLKHIKSITACLLQIHFSPSATGALAISEHSDFISTLKCPCTCLTLPSESLLYCCALLWLLIQMGIIETSGHVLSIVWCWSSYTPKIPDYYGKRMVLNFLHTLRKRK